MQDRFKFRVKFQIDNSIEIFDVENIDIAHQQIFFRREDCNLYNIGFGVKGTELMQCTGLKDKNGKLIYEGDIVTPVYTNATLLEPKITGQVISGKACFQIQSPHIAYNALQILNSEKAFEVIGNIYENPELLKIEE